MVWNALVIVTVLLPLAGLAIDVPRYFALRSRLQIAADAGAEAAARAVDIRHYINTGETRSGARPLRRGSGLGVRYGSERPAASMATPPTWMVWTWMKAPTRSRRAPAARSGCSTT